MQTHRDNDHMDIIIHKRVKRINRNEANMHSDQWIKSHKYLSVTSSCYWYLEAMELTFVIGIMRQISYLCMHESHHEYPNLVVGY
jgi:hypothetical protein